MFHSLVTICFVFPIYVHFLTAEDISIPSDCTPGKIWIRDNIQYECFESSTDKTRTRGYKPVGCVTSGDTVIKPGSFFRDGNFRYVCSEVNSGLLEYAIIACYTPSGYEMNVGSKVKQDGGTYLCNSDVDGSVTRTFTKETTCSFGDQSYNVNSLWVNGDVKLLCYQTNNDLNVRAEYCLTANGTAIKVDDSGKVDNVNLVCRRDPNDVTKATLQTIDSSTCYDKRSGNVYNLNEKWDDGITQFQCVLSDVTTMIKPIKCVMQVNPDDPSSKVFVSLNGYVIVGRRFYWCKSDGNGTYANTFIPANQLVCFDDDDAKYSVNQMFNKGDIRCKCTFVYGTMQIRQVACLASKGGVQSELAKGAILETSEGEAVKCEPDVFGNLTIRRLTDEEYDAWKGVSDVSAKGGRGKGAQSSLTCETGFKLNGTTCQDVDECVLNVDNCTDKEDCRNINGSFICICKDGFERLNPTDGCVDVDECAMHSANCSEIEICINHVPGFACICKNGFKKGNDNKTCEDVDECAEKIVECKENQFCNNTIGSYKCECMEGYIEVEGNCTLPTTTTSVTSTESISSSSSSEEPSTQLSTSETSSEGFSTSVTEITSKKSFEMTTATNLPTETETIGSPSASDVPSIEPSTSEITAETFSTSVSEDTSEKSFETTVENEKNMPTVANGDTSPSKIAPSEKQSEALVRSEATVIEMSPSASTDTTSQFGEEGLQTSPKQEEKEGFDMIRGKTFSHKFSFEEDKKYKPINQTEEVAIYARTSALNDRTSEDVGVRKSSEPPKDGTSFSETIEVFEMKTVNSLFRSKISDTNQSSVIHRSEQMTANKEQQFTAGKSEGPKGSDQAGSKNGLKEDSAHPQCHCDKYIIHW